MISFDTNILLPAAESTNKDHAAAADFLESLQDRDDVAISEMILLELYVLLRNPAVVPRARTAAQSVAICDAFRHHPRWQVLGLPPETRAFHDALWLGLRKDQLARRRAYDWRSALSLLQQGVTEFATVNLKDFTGFGFARVWNPLTRL